MIASLTKKRTPSSLLGLSLDGNRLDIVQVRRTNGTLHIVKSLSAPLALNPMDAAPELVGREIRNHLDQAGIKEKRCVLGLTANWALTLNIPIPEIPTEDIPGFLEIEAERGFPYSPDSLSQSSSVSRPVGGSNTATLVAIPRTQLERLEAGLRAAQLKPLSFTLGITALQPPESDTSNGIVALVPGEKAVELMITCGGGIAALRSLDDVIETEGVQKRLNPDRLARELRVTLGQLPENVRGVLRRVRVFGSGEFAHKLAQDLVARVSAMGLQVEHVLTTPTDAFRSKPPTGTPISSALAVAARHVTSVPCLFEFLPPRVSALQQLTARFSSRKLGWIGGTVGVAAALMLAALIYQQWQLTTLDSRWQSMSKEVTELEDMQAQIRKYRPWFDDSFRTLSILRRVTEAFPETGIVTAKTIEIRDSSTITCSGTARDNQSFLRMLDQLRASKEIGNVKVDQLRGKSPLQFTLNFQWGPGGTSDN